MATADDDHIVVVSILHQFHPAVWKSDVGLLFVFIVTLK
jgi:hypothetical protein